MSQAKGADGIDKTKPPRGRGRGMVRKTSEENNQLSSGEPPGPPTTVKTDETTNAEKTRETKVRRTKAGYEPYQVKKKLTTLSLLDSKLPNRSGSVSSKDKKDRKSSEEGERRNSNSRSQSSRDRGSRNKGNQNKSNHRHENSSRKHSNESSRKLHRTSSSSEREYHQREEKTVLPEKPKLTKEQEEKLKQKTLGLSILECPCNISPNEDCEDCLPTENNNFVKDTLNIDSVPENDETDSVIDNKFLVASPRILHKEKSGLEDFDNQESHVLGASLGNINDEILGTDNSSIMTHEDVNTMVHTFTDTDGHSTVSGTSESIFSEGTLEGTGSRSSIITISSSSDTGSNPKVNSLDGEKMRKHSRDSDSKTRPRPRNVLSSIQSILNENKTLDAKVRPSNSNVTNTYRRKDSPQRDDDRKKNDNRKKRDRKDSTKRHSKTRTNSNSSDKQSGGILTLPHDYQEQMQVEQKEMNHRQVHFEMNEKQAAKESKDEFVAEKQRIVQNKIKELKVLLQKPFDHKAHIIKVMTISEAIQQTYKELIVHYQEYSFKHDFETALWKSAYHNIITKFRDIVDSTKNIEKDKLQEVGNLYWTFLQNGIQFLDELVVLLQEHSHFDLQEILDDPVKMHNCGKQVKLGLRSCHLLLIYIGDLERYITHLQPDNNYTQAQKCYKEAQMLAPKNGKSYNQLAVVAVTTKRKLDAVYYYCRSLLASNPILTARDRLTSIFHEIKKKAKLFNQRYEQQSSSHNKEEIILQERADKLNPNHLRDEIWIFIHLHQMYKLMLTDKNELVYLTQLPLKNDSSHEAAPVRKTPLSRTTSMQDKLSLSKINRGYTIYFLYAHCKLYTNIGLEEFTKVHQETLSYLKTLLQYPKASSVKQENLLKYVAINIFSIQMLIEKQQGLQEVMANTALDFAIVFAVDMCGVLCSHCSKLLLTTKDFDKLDQFLPAVRVMFLWMVNQSTLISKSSVNLMLDIWSEICPLLNDITDMKLQVIDGTSSSQSSQNAYLVEDIFLAGFKPYSSKLLHGPASETLKDKVCHNLRMTSLQELVTQLDQSGQLPFAYDEKERTYKAVQATQVFTSPVKQKKEFDEEIDNMDITADVIIEDSDDEDQEEEENYNFEHSGDHSQLAQLRAQKADLARLLEENEQQRQLAVSVLESHKSEGRVISENSPNHLVLDTNCFIDYLPHVQKLLASKGFTIIAPLIVINELDGLKKGTVDPNHLSVRARNVRDAARLAIDFLEDRFSVFDSNLRAITSSGSEMTTIAFRSEELSQDRGTNDDVILSCCLKYCKEHFSYEGTSKIVRREVVLLTNDRNLRVKAHSRYVPTVPMLTFMKMAQML